ncbi:MAG: glycosyltransferase 87 family protein [Methanomassiliicoccaceae archaeon]|nr:glycosyltransferase 87 family protein [Methanomassiliicoccaceae archaeon]
MELFNRSGTRSEKPIAGRIGRNLLYIFIIGMALRLVLGPLSFSFDLSFFVITGAGFESGQTLYEAGNFYYPPVYGYFLSALTYIWNLLPFQAGEMSELLVGSSAVSDFSQIYISSMALTFFYKIPLTMIDLACSWLIYAMVKEKTGDRRKAEIGFALFFLSPLVIWSSSVACMFDSLSAFLMIFSIYSLTKNQYMLSGAMLSLALFTKLFPIVIGFAVICYIISRSEGRWKDIFKRMAMYALGFALMATIVLLPILLNGEGSSALKFFGDRVESSSSGGGSLLDFFADPTPDKFIYAFPIIFLLIAILSMLIFMRDGDDDKKLVMASVMSICMVFIWPPIPTYPVIAIAVIALAVAYCGRREWLIPWLLFSVLMVVHHIFNFGNRILYTLANETALLDLGSAITSYFQFQPLSWDIMYYTLPLLFVPGISCIIAAAYTLKHAREAVE